MKINTHQRYTATGNERIFDVTEQHGSDLTLTETLPDGQVRTGHARYENGIVYMQELFAGHYYPTNYTVVN